MQKGERFSTLRLSPEVFVTQLAWARSVGWEKLRWSDERLRYALVEALAVLALRGGRFHGWLRWCGDTLPLHLSFWRRVAASVREGEAKAVDRSGGSLNF